MIAYQKMLMMQDKDQEQEFSISILKCCNSYKIENTFEALGGG